MSTRVLRNLVGTLVLASASVVNAAAPQVAWTLPMSGKGDPLGSDFTCRVPARVGIAGSAIRVTLSNADGGAPLKVDAIHVAVRQGGARAVTFGGQSSVTIAAGREATSDEIGLAVAANQALTVSLYFAGPTPAPTELKYTTSSRCTRLSGGGNHVADADDSAFTVTRPHYWLTAVDAYVPQVPRAATVLAIGDSITQGGNPPWTERLAARLSQRDPQRTVVNSGINGNTLCDGGSWGPSITSRLERDVFGRAGVSHVVVFAGTNDISMGGKNGPQVIDCYRKVVQRLHERGLKVIGGTVIPRNWFDPARNASRSQVNAWVRDKASGLDGYIDFDLLMRDPAAPNKVLAKYDSGDGTHPNQAGQNFIGDSVQLALFESAAPPDAGAPDAAGPDPMDAAIASDAAPPDAGVLADRPPAPPPRTPDAREETDQPEAAPRAKAASGCVLAPGASRTVWPAGVVLGLLGLLARRRRAGVTR